MFYSLPVSHRRDFLPNISGNILPVRNCGNWITASVEKGGRGYVIVTEKDAARLLNCPRISSLLKRHLYYLPLHVHFMLEQEPAFNNQIKESVIRFQRRVIQKKK